METFFAKKLKNIHEKFKSYYVVWKHAKGMSGFFAFGWFKSYYVVWKPFCAAVLAYCGASLNRTM